MMELVVPEQHLDKENPTNQEENDLTRQHDTRILQQHLFVK